MYLFLYNNKMNTERIISLQNLIDALQDCKRLNALAAVSGMPSSTFKFSLVRTLDGWKEELKQWSTNQDSPVPRKIAVSAMAVLPSNSFAPLIEVTAAAWLRNLHLIVKPARGSDKFVKRWIEIIRQLLPSFDITETFETSKLDYDRLIVFGSDETVDIFRKRFGREKDLFGFGHRFSIAYVDSDLENAAENAAADIVSWNQLGCLSPQTIFVKSKLVFDFAEVLAEKINKAEQIYPRGEVNIETSYEIQRIRREVAVRDNSKVIASTNSTAWTVLLSPDNRLESCPLNRTAWVKPADSIQELNSILSPHIHHVEAIGIWPEDKLNSVLKEESKKLSDTYLLLGKMQSPSLSRMHSGLPPLAFTL